MGTLTAFLLAKMSRNLTHRIGFACSLIAIGFQSEAVDIENVYINGFISQGYLKSTANSYSGDTEDGTWEFNEMALSVKSVLSENLSAGIQLISRDFGYSGNNDIKIDWGFLDYRINDAIGVRLGKFKRPDGLYNTVRDADSVRNPVLLPQGIYSERLRDILIAVQGIGLYGFVDMNKTGSLDYSVYLGNQPIDPEEQLVKEVLLKTTFGVTDADSVEFKYAYGGQVFWNTPITGLRVGESIYVAAIEVNGTNTTYPWYTSSIRDAMFKTPMRSVTSIEYQQEKFTISAEYMLHKFETSDSPIGGAITPYGFPAGGEWKFDLESYYLQAVYQLSDKLQIGAYHSWYYRKLNDKWHRDVPSEKLNDLALSLKYSVNEWWTLKAEVHMFDGYLFVDPDESGVLDDKWQLFAVKSTISF